MNNHVTPSDEARTSALGHGLKQRHVTMLSITGVSGPGLFVGSANAIIKAGPAVLISYALAGTLVVLVMRMLGEMATATPTPAPSRRTPTARSAGGPVSRSAGCTGGSG